MDKIDRIFQKEINAKFSFNKEVASVFDNMIERSIPYYRDNIDLIARILESRNYHSICDMGCSSGNLLLHLSSIPSFKSKKLLGIDNSPYMLDIAKSKSRAYGANIEFIKKDILDFDFSFDAVISNYTLQFIRPPNRSKLIKKIYNSLSKEGCFILSEKLICEDKQLDLDLTNLYYGFKKENGYSDTEIAKKREALENILIPYSQDENINLLKDSGFSFVEVIFRWANFATFIAIKN